MKVVSDEGSGPVAVLLHGQPGDADDFTLVRLALQGMGLRVIAVDRPGYDTATPATGYAGNATALAGLLDDLGVVSARLLGLSWAGGVALRFALAYPDRVDGLLLAASVGAPASVVPSDRLMALPVAVTISKLAAPRLAGLLERRRGRSSIRRPAHSPARRRCAGRAPVGGTLSPSSSGLWSARPHRSGTRSRRRSVRSPSCRAPGRVRAGGRRPAARGPSRRPLRRGRRGPPAAPRVPALLAEELVNLGSKP